MYFVLALNYTMQIQKAKERKVCKEQTQQQTHCHAMERIKEDHTEEERECLK